MVFNVVAFVVTWLVVYLLERKNIFQLWLKPVNRRIKQFSFGFLLMAILCLMSQFLIGQITQTSWGLHEHFNLRMLFQSLTYDFNSVLFEELVFRGLLLYLLLKYSKTPFALILSAIAFGVYHWFTGGVLGHLVGMVVVFIVTGFMGYVFAYAYAKTTSIVLPFALHFGWNSVNHVIFSHGPNGDLLLKSTESTELVGLYSLLPYVIYLLVAGIVLLYVKSSFVVKGPG